MSQARFSYRIFCLIDSPSALFVSISDGDWHVARPGYNATQQLAFGSFLSGFSPTPV
jgi:hypothetical protein